MGNVHFRWWKSMKALIWIFVFLAVSTFLVGCGKSEAEKAKETAYLLAIDNETDNLTDMYEDLMPAIRNNYFNPVSQELIQDLEDVAMRIESFAKNPDTLDPPEGFE
jgi:hypothetical protein